MLGLRGLEVMGVIGVLGLSILFLCVRAALVSGSARRLRPILGLRRNYSNQPSLYKDTDVKSNC